MENNVHFPILSPTFHTNGDQRVAITEDIATSHAHTIFESTEDGRVWASTIGNKKD